MKVGIIEAPGTWHLELIEAIKPLCEVQIVTKDNQDIDIFLCYTQPEFVVTKPVYLYIDQNPYVGHIHSFFSQASPANYKYAGIILAKHLEEYITYLETVFNTPVATVPQIFIPLNYDIVANTKDAKLNIIIHQQNTNFNTTSWKALIIAEYYYLHFPEHLRTVYLFNTPEDNKQAMDMIYSLQIWKDKKMRILKSFAKGDILRFLGNEGGKTIILQNSIYESVDSFLLSAAEVFPILHTSAFLKAEKIGTHYDANDIKWAATLLRAVQSKTSKEKLETFYKKFAPDAASESLKKILKIHEKPVKINLSEVIDLADLSKPLCVSFENETNANTDFFISTLKNNGWQYAILGKDAEWKGWITRMTAYKTFLSSLAPEKIVVLTDTRGVFCVRQPDAFIGAFRSFNTPMVVSSEMFCGLTMNITPGYKNNSSLDIYWKDVVRPDRQFVNNGLVAGTAAALLAFYKFALDGGFTDDQLALSKYVDTNATRVVLDVDAKFLHTSGAGMYSGLCDVQKQSRDGPNLSELMGRGAFFLHFPCVKHSMGQKKMYTICESLLKSGVSDEFLREDMKDAAPSPPLWNCKINFNESK